MTHCTVESHDQLNPTCRRAGCNACSSYVYRCIDLADVLVGASQRINVTPPPPFQVQESSNDTNHVLGNLGNETDPRGSSVARGMRSDMCSARQVGRASGDDFERFLGMSSAERAEMSGLRSRACCEHNVACATHLIFTWSFCNADP